MTLSFCVVNLVQTGTWQILGLQPDRAALDSDDDDVPIVQRIPIAESCSTRSGVNDAARVPWLVIQAPNRTSGCSWPSPLLPLGALLPRATSNQGDYFL